MEIVQYTPDLQTPLTHFYNRLAGDVPHCYPIKEAEFAIEMREINRKADKTEGGPHSETVFVAMQNGAVQAFIHVGLNQIREEDIGIIRFLGYERGARYAGQAVLEKGEAYLKTHNVTRIFAFPDCAYRFYHLAYASLSDALDHVQAHLGFNGYRRYSGWVFFDWEDYDIIPTSPPIPVTLSVNWHQERGELPDCTIKAYQDAEQIGECCSVSGGETSNHADAQDWFHTVWLGIEDEFQGRGLGHYLLQYTLQEMEKIGYRHAAISTGWDDYRAQLFYCNCGYQVVDWTYTYEKALSEPPTHN